MCLLNEIKLICLHFFCLLEMLCERHSLVEWCFLVEKELMIVLPETKIIVHSCKLYTLTLHPSGFECSSVFIVNTDF